MVLTTGASVQSIKIGPYINVSTKVRTKTKTISTKITNLKTITCGTITLNTIKFTH